MRKPTAKRALLAALLARYGWESPIPREHLLRIAAIEPGEHPSARRAFAELRNTEYVENRGKRGISLDTGAFDALADVLYYECGWKPYQIKSRLKHYEGWRNHEWRDMVLRHVGVVPSFLHFPARRQSEASEQTERFRSLFE